MHFRFARVAGRVAFLAACSILCTAVAQASTITVNNLADDVFPDGAERLWREALHLRTFFVHVESC